MSQPQDDSFWGMTGQILRRLDAQERLKKKEGPSAAGSVSSKPGWRAGFSAGFSVSREITSRHKLALMYHVRGQHAEAERQYQEVLASLGEAVGPKHIEMSGVFNNLGRLYYELQRYAEAEPLLQRSLAIVEQTFGAEHPKVARRLANLADLYAAMGRPADAGEFYQRALAIEEKTLGLKDPATRKTRAAYEAFLKTSNLPPAPVSQAAQHKVSGEVPQKKRRENRSGTERRTRIRRVILITYEGREKRRLAERRIGKGRRSSEKMKSAATAQERRANSERRRSERRKSKASSARERRRPPNRRGPLGRRVADHSLTVG